MKKVFYPRLGISSIHIGIALSVALLAFFVVSFFMVDNDPDWLVTKLARSNQKMQLVQSMGSELLASAEAEKSAVMADSDEASNAFAEQSGQASQRVEKARTEFDALVDKNSKESKIFEDFSSCWVRLQDLDRKVLSLAVQNTNLKAQRLSFVPAAGAIKCMQEALYQVMALRASNPDEASIIWLASQALAGALNIYALEAPHIAETSDAEMDRMEAEMERFDERVRDALSGLEGRADDALKPTLGEARKCYREFQAVHVQIIDLSRQNSNIRSLAVSLGQKRNLMAQCLDRLNGLKDVIHEGMTVKATK